MDDEDFYRSNLIYGFYSAPYLRLMYSNNNKGFPFHMKSSKLGILWSRNDFIHLQICEWKQIPQYVLNYLWIGNLLYLVFIV